MNSIDLTRLAFLLDVVGREGRHLLQTFGRLFQEEFDSEWLARLENDVELSERVDAFAARFGRMQDSLGEKLIPELLRCVAETPGSALDNLRRLERLELLSSAAEWIEARNLRNRLVHEYVRDPQEFTGALKRSGELVSLLIETFNAICSFATERFPESAGQFPSRLQIDSATRPRAQR